MSILKKVIFAVILAPLTISCSSDDDNNPAPTVKEMLMSGKWYWEEIDEYKDLTPCEKTTFIHFYGKNDFSYISYYSFNDIDCVIENSTSGTFELISDVLIKVVDSETAESSELEIISISENELALGMADGHNYIFDKTEGE